MICVIIPQLDEPIGPNLTFLGAFSLCHATESLYATASWFAAGRVVLPAGGAINGRMPPVKGRFLPGDSLAGKGGDHNPGGIGGDDIDELHCILRSVPRVGVYGPENRVLP